MYNSLIIKKYISIKNSKIDIKFLGIIRKGAAIESERDHVSGVREYGEYTFSEY